MNSPRYDVSVKLIGEDGNAFSIMAKVCRALRKAGANKDEIEEYTNQAMSADYDNLLSTTTEWVNVE